MNISFKKNDAATSGILTIEIVKADYAEQLEKSLRSFRQNVTLPGFRKGMVPVGMVKKLHGKQLLAEEVNKLISDNLYSYVKENDLNLLGEPLANATEQPEIDFDKQEDFTFCFDLILSPEVKITLNRRDKLTLYKPIVEEDAIEKQIESYKANFGSYESAEDNIEEKDLLKGVLTELENGSPKEGGIFLDDAVLMPMYVKDADEKAKFMASKKDGVVVFNPNKAYNGIEVEIASFLKIEKSAVADMTSDFSFEIKEITRHKEAELNQELFDKVFGEGAVTSEEEFKNKVKESLSEQFFAPVNFKFLTDARELFLKKTSELVFADDLLKRWLVETNKNKTAVDIDADYPKILDDLKFQLVKESLLKEHDVKVEEADVEAFAIRVAKAQFAQYGMYSAPDDVLLSYAKDLLKDKATLQNIVDRVIEDKLATCVKGLVKLEEKEITIGEFEELMK
jgi:FKBP-type peptidyl-prolyl cis-trans isomerase (trigger factor)